MSWDELLPELYTIIRRPLSTRSLQALAVTCRQEAVECAKEYQRRPFLFFTKWCFLEFTDRALVRSFVTDPRDRLALRLTSKRELDPKSMDSVIAYAQEAALVNGEDHQLLDLSSSGDDDDDSSDLSSSL